MKGISLDIPSQAVVFETNHYEPDTTLRDYVRPLEGGLQVTPIGGGACTFSFNASWNGSFVWLTASHCSDTFWSTDYTDFYQPTSGAEDYAGYESYDPSPFGCGYGQCRYSDATVISRPSHVSYDLGYIAQTTGTFSITINASAPQFEIVEQYLWPQVGWDVGKIGRSTGWTTGEIQDDCMDVGHAAGMVLICQVTADYSSQPGDSGSPVFGGPQSNQVVLYGIHHGRLTESPYYAVFSPMGGVINDFGSMDATTPPGGGGGGGGGGDCVDENGNPIPC